MLSATVNASPKPFIIWFNENRLAAKRDKYGDALILHKETFPMQPAAKGTATVEGWQNDLAIPAREKPVQATKPAKVKPVREEKKVAPEPKKRIRKAKEKKPVLKNPARNAIPVVNVSTGSYYANCMEAAAAIGCHPCSVHKLISGIPYTRGGKRTTVRGNLIRAALPEEVKAGKFIDKQLDLFA